MSAGTSPFRPVALGPYDVDVEQHSDGTVLLRSNEPLEPYPERYTEWLLRWAAERPDGCFLAKRVDSGDWRRLTYREALEGVERLAQALLARGLGPERPLVILSGNDIEHALLALAAMHVGIPTAAVSPAYSLLSTDHERLRHAVRLLTPGLVFASDAAAFAPAIAAAVPADVGLVFARGSLPDRESETFASLLKTQPTAEVARAHEAVGPNTVAKFLFTSGSTDLPKAVINTHRMLCCNLVMNVQCYPYTRQEAPVLVDWLPWHHTGGGNANFGLVLGNGGTMYIDDGKPTASGIAETLRNLREISPTACYTVPKGLESLVTAMEGDSALRDNFFRRLRVIFPAGAALPSGLKRRVDELAFASVGCRIPMTLGLGMTETAPFALSAHLPEPEAGMIGIPAPGVEVKLVPSGDKLEVRYRGPNITPGYWRQPELTRAAFDEEGYFRSGDAARLVDDTAPRRGLRFDGRIAEDFKLVSGTFVNVGALRRRIVAAGAPFVQDAVITGHDRDTVGMMLVLFPSAREISSNLGPSASPADIASDPDVQRWAQRLLDRLAAEGTGSSNRVVRAIVLSEPPSLETGEMTDKGSINQRAVLKRRAELVQRLYDDAAHAEVLRAGSTAAA